MSNRQKQNDQLMLIICVLGLAWILGFGSSFGLYSPLGIDFSGSQSGGGGYQSAPSTPTPPLPPASRSASPLQFSIQNAITRSSVTTGNTKVDICRAIDGLFDFTQGVEQISVNSAPEQSTVTFSQGDLLVLHISCDVDFTGGTDSYDGLFVTWLEEGTPIYHLTPSMLSKQTGNRYKLTAMAGEATGFKVQYTSGTTNYWGLGSLFVEPRCTAANLDVSASYGATVLSSVTDGSTWDVGVTGGADATLSTHSEDVTILLDGGAVSVGYGHPMYTIKQHGELETRSAFLMVSTNMTTIGVSSMQAEGWVPLQDSSLYNEKAFYKIIDPMSPNKGQTFSQTYTLPIDSSAASVSSGYYFKIWIIDFQLEGNVQMGAPSTSIPTAYGFLGEFGLDAMIFARAYSASSGVGGSQVLSFVITTAA